MLRQVITAASIVVVALGVSKTPAEASSCPNVTVCMGDCPFPLFGYCRDAQPGCIVDDNDSSCMTNFIDCGPGEEVTCVYENIG